MSYERKKIFQTPKFSERICGWIGNPPLSPLPYQDGRNISKIKLRWTPITHPRMLKSDTHLGLILSSNFLIGSLAESLYPKAMCVLFGQAPTSQPIKNMKKASPST